MVNEPGKATYVDRKITQARLALGFERLWAAHASGAARHGTRLWLLLWLELWFRMFVDRTFGPEDGMPALTVG